jgi:site-specific DNA-methyltransferase (adenine-specific)
MAYQSGSRIDRHDKIKGDDTLQVRDDILAMWGDKPAILFGTWRQPRPAGTRVVGVWDKTDGIGPGMGDLNMPFGTSHEEFYLLGGPWKLHTKRRGSVVRTSMAMGNPFGTVSIVGHPTAKPVSVMEVMVQATNPQSTIADPCCGSGSTLIAARNLMRPAIGVELVEKYCEIAARRLDQGVLDFGDTA